MDAGCLQNPTLVIGARSCCSSCCCNVPSTQGHCQVLSNAGWRSNSIGLTFQHPRGVVYAKRRKNRCSNMVQASIVSDAAVAAVAAVAASVLPMCWHFTRKGRPSDSEASCLATSFAAAPSTMTAAIEAVGLSSSSAIADGTPAALRLGERDTAELQSRGSASSSSDEDEGIGEGWSVSSVTSGSVEVGTNCSGRGAIRVTVASSRNPPAVLRESVGKECRTPDLDSEDHALPNHPDAMTGLTRAGLLADAGLHTVNAIVPSEGEDSSEREATAIEVRAPILDISYSSTSETYENQSDSCPPNNEPRVNGVSTRRGRFLHRDSAAEGLKKVQSALPSCVPEQSRPCSSQSLSASRYKKSSLLEGDDQATDDERNAVKKPETLLHHDNAKGLTPQTKMESARVHLPHEGVGGGTNGSCSLHTTGTEQDGNEGGIAGMEEKVLQADARENGSVFVTTKIPNSKSPKRNRRKQSQRDSLADLWEEFLQVQDGSVAKVLSPERYETLYQKLLSAQRIQDCLEVFESMDKLGILDMNLVYHTKFFNAFKKHQAVKEAFRFMKLIKYPSLSTYNQLLSVCASAQNVEGAFEVLALLEKAGLKADCIMYTTAISACAKAGKVDRIFQVFHEMVNNGVEPNIHTYGALIDGCARAGAVAKAFGVYGIMRSKKLKPDRVIFNSLITACGRSGAIERAFDVLSEMNAEPIPVQPNHVTIGALITACTQAGEVSRAYDVYRMMKDKGIDGSTEAYTAAVHACSRNGDFHTAREIYEDMKKAQIQADEIFFSALIDVAGHAGKLDSCFELLKEMKQVGLKPGVVAYSAVMGACSNTGSWERGLTLYKEMLAASISPNLSTMNALLSALCGNGQFKAALTILQEMRDGSIIPNHITYGVLIAASEKVGNIDIAYNLYKKAMSEGVIPTIKMCESIIGLCLKQIWKLSSGPTPTSSFTPIAEHSFCQKCVGWALSVYRETRRAGIVPTVRVISQLLGCLRLPRTDEASFHGHNGAVQHESSKQLSLIDGFGIYDPRALSLFEEAAALAVVPSFSYTDGPIIINAAGMPVFIAEVYLLTLLRALKHSNAAGARLPFLTILLTGEDKDLIRSTSCEKKVFVLTRTSQAIAALLRRLRLNFRGHESSGELKISPTAIRRWLQPKKTRRVDRGQMWQPDAGPQRLSLGKQIAEQQRFLRYQETPVWHSPISQPPNGKEVQHFPITNGSHLQDSPKLRTWGDQNKSCKAADPQEIKATPQISGPTQILSKLV